MSQKNIWNKYITAQSKILVHKSKPIGIDTSKSVQLDGLTLHLSIDQEIFKHVFKNKVEQIFNVRDYEFESGYIQTTLENTLNITPEKLNKLKELAKIYYIEFNENPVVEGVILANNTDTYDEFKNAIREIPTDYHFKNSGLIFLTLEKWKRTKEIKGVKFAQKIGAVYPLKLSLTFLISSFYRNIEISQNGKKITVVGELHQNLYELFEKNIGLSNRGNCLIFKFNNTERLNIEIKKLKKTESHFQNQKMIAFTFILTSVFMRNTNQI